MSSPAFRRGVIRLLPFGVIWLAASAVFLLIEWSVYGGRFVASETAIVPDAGILAFALFAMTLLGVIVGYFELNYLNERFTGVSFLRKAAYKFVVYLVFIHLVVLVTFPLAAAMEQKTSVLDPAVWRKLGRYLTSLTHFNTVLQLSVTIGLSIVYAQVSEVIGHTTLVNYLAGTYHRPIREERVFLFLDMRGSTTIAERLGHQRYFKLLRAYYRDLSQAVVRHGGEIYLYVGDEIIVSWKLTDGLRDNNCLRCFFAMQRDLAVRSDWYRQHFGEEPSFKAGLHYGTVTTGEIGTVKKHIMFTGDVLNVTARIQALCNTYGVDVLLSFNLLERLPLGEEYTLRHIGRPDLRGRSEPLRLYTVARAETDPSATET